MATINELIAALNAKSDSISSTYNERMTPLVDRANKTLDNMDGILGVQEVLPIDRDETESFTTTNIVDGPQTEVGLTGTGEAIMGTDIPAPRNILSDTVDAAKNYLEGGGLMGIAARGIGTLFEALLPQSLKDSPIDKFNRGFAVENYGDPFNYGLGPGNLTGVDPFGINTVSGLGDYQKYYEDYLNAFENQTKFGDGIFGFVPSQTSQFAQNKADFAREVLGLKDSSPNITGTPLLTRTSDFSIPDQDRGAQSIQTSGGNIGERTSASFREDKDFGLL